MSEDDVEKELQAEEEECWHRGGRVYHEMSVHKFVALGIEPGRISVSKDHFLRVDNCAD